MPRSKDCMCKLLLVKLEQVQPNAFTVALLMPESSSTQSSDCLSQSSLFSGVHSEAEGWCAVRTGTVHTLTVHSVAHVVTTEVLKLHEHYISVWAVLNACRSPRLDPDDPTPRLPRHQSPGPGCMSVIFNCGVQSDPIRVPCASCEL